MLNYLWAFMLVLGITVGAISGKIDVVSSEFINSSKEAINLCITMLGIMAMWTGIMKIAEKSGLVKTFTRWLTPFIRFLFPDIPKEHIVNEYIASNIIANILGLGWAATPMGLKAMKELADIDKQRHGGKETKIASTEMCTFLIINISSLQLIPVNIIAYRSQYGSTNPMSIVLPAIIATSISTIVGVIFAKIMSKNKL